MSAIVIAETAIVCQESELIGNFPITIGNGCIVHPKCIIKAENGPITIGDGCIIEEQVKIVNRSKEPLVIGKNNTLQVGAVIECKSIGDANVIENKAHLASGSTVHNYCIIGTCARVPENDIIENFTIIFGVNNTRRKYVDESNSTEKSFTIANILETNELQANFLKQNLPMFHHLRKSLTL